MENKDKELIQKDKIYKNHLDTIGRKVEALQEELKKIHIYEEKIQNLNQIIREKDQELCNQHHFFKEKIKDKKINYKKQKNEWNTVYNELVFEIQQLRNDNDSLDFENKKLINTVNSFKFYDAPLSIDYKQN